MGATTAPILGTTLAGLGRGLTAGSSVLGAGSYDWAAPSASLEASWKSLLEGTKLYNEPQTRQIEAASGASTFEVEWSVTVTAAGKFTKPTFDGLRFVETTWDGNVSA
jgi:hypothetical protein